MPPKNLTILKGSLNVLLKREFAQFVATNKFAIDLYNWLQDMFVPDESFFATMSSVRMGPNNTITQDIPKITGQKDVKVSFSFGTLKLLLTCSNLFKNSTAHL